MTVYVATRNKLGEIAGFHVDLSDDYTHEDAAEDVRDLMLQKENHMPRVALVGLPGGANVAR